MKQKIKNFLMKRRFKPLKNKRGFSLVEMLVTVGIIGVLATVAVPAYKSYNTSAAKNSLIASLRVVGNAVTACRASKADVDCDTLGEVKVSTDTASPVIFHTINGTAPTAIVTAHTHFCAYATNTEFRGCISIKKDDGSFVIHTKEKADAGNIGKCKALGVCS